MRVGIDARSLSDPLTGIGRLVYNIIDQFYTRQNEHEFFLYSHKPFDHFPEKNGWHCRFGTGLSRKNSTLWLFFEGRRRVVEDRIDVFWTPFPIAPRISGVKTAITILDLAWFVAPESMKFEFYWLHRLMVPLSLRSADKTFSISSSTVNDVRRYYPWYKQEVALIPCAVAPGFFKQGEVLPREKITQLLQWNGPFLFTVLRLERRKNIVRLIRAFRLLKDKGSAHKLVIAGDRGPDAHRIRKECRDLGLEKEVVFLGYISESQLVSLYAYSNAFIFPSTYEGFGIPILEAMACGCPVVLSNASSLPEVAGEAGLYFDPYDIVDISKKIDQILKDDVLRADLIRKGHSRLSCFSWTDAADIVLDGLTGLCERKN